MSDQDLEKLVSRFERVLTARPMFRDDVSLTRCMRELMATRQAISLLASVRARYPGHVRIECQSEQTGLRPSLPNVAAVVAAGPKLVETVARQNAAGTIEALKQMGVFALCPPLNIQISRLEFSVGCVIGDIRLYPLIELALLAAELGADERLADYLSEAYAYNPVEPHLHYLRTIAGVIACYRGDFAEAKTCLFRSIRKDDNRHLLIIDLSIVLAKRLLAHGEDTAVVEFLTECQGFMGRRAPFAACIENIKKGQHRTAPIPGPLEPLDEYAAFQDALFPIRHLL